MHLQLTRRPSAVIRWHRSLLALAVGICVAAGAPLGQAASAVTASEPWTAPDPDSLIARCAVAAEGGGEDALARLVLLAAMADHAAASEARRLLRGLHRGAPALLDQAQWLARQLDPDPPVGTWRDSSSIRYEEPPHPEGLVRSFAVLGPFEDTGGGLDRREGPEEASHDYRAADYSWGAFTVRTSRSLPAAVTARGLALDLHVHPRQESCTYLESVVTVAPVPRRAGGLVLLVASAGAFRVSWDGVEVARSVEQHPRALLDRAAVRLDRSDGEHLLSIKVCSGALADAGRVRARLVDSRYRPVPVASSSAPSRLRSLATAIGARASADRAGGVERVPTPLERALAAGEEGSARSALVAAVLRTLGGAEDLRSPRAPGLLDRVVASPALRVDELALAGWVTPSGADRSGWLALAHRRAMAEQDEATAAFALRALVRWRLQARLVELAAATVSTEPLRSAGDADARLLQAFVSARRGGSGVRYAALERLRAIEAEYGKATPVAAWRAIARETRAGPARLHLQALEQIAARRPGSRGARWARALRQRGAEALERGITATVPYQSHAEDWVTAGELLLEAGRPHEALQLFRLTTALSPNIGRAHRGLARAELLLSSSPAATVRGLAALRRVERLEPQDAEVAAELPFRRRGDEAGSVGRQLEDERFIVPAAQFLARARAVPARPGEHFERQVHFLRVVRLHPDKRVSQLVHYAREIVVEPRTEAERQERIVALSPNTELLLARVHRQDGAVLPPEEQETPSGAMPSVLWPKLERGDVVEVAVRAWTPGPIGRRGEVPFYFVDYVGSVETRPVLYNEVVLDVPRRGGLYFDVLNGAPDRKEVEPQRDRTVTRLIWESPPTIPDEPLRPPPSELLPVVVGSGFASWDQFVEWYRGAVAGFTEPDAQIRRLAAELTASTTGRPLSLQEKLAALFEFVADDIRYVNYVSGEWWLPNRPQQLLARRQGDCDDKAMLLISLLKAIGVHAVEALIQTRLVGQPSILQSPRVAIPMFDHGIVYLPPQVGLAGQFLDATNPESRLGPLVSMDSAARALLVPPPAGSTGPRLPLPEQALGQAGQVRVMETPPANAADHGAKAQWTLAISAEGEGMLQAAELHVGDAALLLRTHLQQPDARAQWIEQHLLAGWLPTVEMDPEVDFEGDLPGGAARLTYRARSRLLARREGADWVVALAPSMPLTARLAPEPTRTLPVMLPPAVAPRHHDLVVRLEAPPTYRFSVLPPDQEVEGGPFGRARQSFARSLGAGPGGGEVVVLTREVALEQWNISAQQYPAWRTWLQRIDRLLQHGVRLVPR